MKQRRFRPLGLFIAVITLSTSGACAQTISFDLQADLLQTAVQGDALATDSLVMLLADTSQDGFDLTASPGIGSGVGDVTANADFFDGADDLILWRGDLSTNLTAGLLAESPSLTLGTYGSAVWDLNDPLALVWFPSISTASFTFSGTYGLYDGSGTVSATSEAWVTPSAGTSGYSLHAFTTNSAVLPTGANSGNLSPSVLVAAVPEPSTYATVAGLFALLFCLIRRSWRRAR